MVTLLLFVLVFTLSIAGVLLTLYMKVLEERISNLEDAASEREALKRLPVNVNSQ